MACAKNLLVTNIARHTSVVDALASRVGCVIVSEMSKVVHKLIEVNVPIAVQVNLRSATARVSQTTACQTESTHLFGNFTDLAQLAKIAVVALKNLLQLLDGQRSLRITGK
jgi:hypothetical protein